jgi:hypothetical protein
MVFWGAHFWVDAITVQISIKRAISKIVPAIAQKDVLFSNIFLPATGARPSTHAPPVDDHQTPSRKSFRNR